MSQIGFQASECHSGGIVKRAAYTYRSDGPGWLISREGRPYLSLDRGYVPLQVAACGVCATDLARHHLPFPLPQVAGHEVLALRDGAPVVVDINASHHALGHGAAGCPYCAAGLPTHCPARMTLGIDRLPGGFAPWILAPEQAVYPIGDVPVEIAPLTEPMAAALQALAQAPPRQGEKVAVLGPRRLGMLLLTALAAYRTRAGIDYDITAVTRHSALLGLAGMLGADKGLHANVVPLDAMREKYDVVYDTTGSPEGLATALAMTRRVVHLKSTHGEPVMGLRCLSELVIDELAVLPLDPAHFDFAWAGETRANRHVLVMPSVPTSLLPEPGTRRYHVMAPDEAARALRDPAFLDDAPLPQFDLAVVGSLAEMDAVLRPQGADRALVRPRGALLLAPLFGETPLEDAVNARGIQIHTSRCGVFPDALAVMAQPDFPADILAEHFITHHLPADRLEEAMGLAADSRAAVKVVVTHDREG